MPTDKQLGFICLFILCMVIVVYTEYEHFGSKDEKINAIFDYFKTTDQPSYNSYKTAMDHKSNIVDYEVASALINKTTPEDFIREMKINI